MKCLYKPNWNCWKKEGQPTTEECISCLISVLCTQIEYQYQLLKNVANRFHFNLSQIEKNIKVDKKEVKNVNEIPQFINDYLLDPVLFMTNLLVAICQKIGVKIK